MALTILYRGPLSSCDLSCWYCPFGSEEPLSSALDHDRRCLERFVSWAESRDDELSVFFVPRGEALLWPWYQDGLGRLSRAKGVRTVAIQTNLGCELGWLRGCDRSKLGLWTTFHPGQVSRRSFLSRCRVLDERGVRYSVGAVGVRESFDEIEALRAELPADVYLWINAFKREDGYYSEEDLLRLVAVDPLFELSCLEYPSLGRRCSAGSQVFFVEGDGNVWPCPFVGRSGVKKLGNIYDGDPLVMRRPGESRCPTGRCRCHIGYAHLTGLGLGEVFGSGVLERVPDRTVRRADALSCLESFFGGADRSGRFRRCAATSAPGASVR